ncbi:MAG: MarR family winged helix-turn-helix transcriptional regulator [Bacteroidota bacterium]
MTSPRQTAVLIMDNVPLLMRVLRAKFREKRVADLSMAQFRTLAFVNANRDASLSEAAGHIGLSLPSMSKLVDVLVKRELLTRVMHGSDRRRICLTLTAEGKRALGEAYEHTQAYFADKLSGLTDEERTQIASVMNLLRSLFELDGGSAPVRPPHE